MALGFGPSGKFAVYQPLGHFCADLFVSLGVSLVGVLGLFSLLRIHIGESNVLKVGMASFVASVASFLAFKVYHGVIRHSTLRGVWRIGGVAISKSIFMFLILVALKANFSPSVYWVGGITDCTLTIVMLITLRVFVINVYNSVLSQLGKNVSVYWFWYGGRERDDRYVCESSCLHAKL